MISSQAKEAIDYIKENIRIEIECKNGLFEGDKIVEVKLFLNETPITSDWTNLPKN